MQVSSLLPVSSSSESVERLFALSGLSKNDWLDLLGLTWKNYYQHKIGFSKLSSASLAQVIKYFNLDEADFNNGSIQFSELERALPEQLLPEKYLIGAHGRQRTTITSLEFLEKKFGWRLKYDVLNHFQISAAALQDPFSNISIQFITDMSEYLKRRQFKSKDFFQMGLYSAEGNRNSLIGKIFADMENLEQAYMLFFNKMMALFESNCTYYYQQVAPAAGLLLVQSSPDVANELKVKSLGSSAICEIKAGMFASLPSYMGLNHAVVTHFTCEHRGDDACRFYIDQTSCTPLSHK